MSDPNDMSFLDHLEELRFRIIRSVIAVAIGTVVLFIWKSLLLDITSVTDFGLLLGAGIAARWKRPLTTQVSLPTRLWIAGAIAALLMGYASRLAYGCNVGAFFSGISTGSLHGWVWFAAAFAGSMIGVRLRNQLIGGSR